MNHRMTNALVWTHTMKCIFIVISTSNYSTEMIIFTTSFIDKLTTTHVELRPTYEKDHDFRPISNGVNFSMSTHRFHGVKFWLLNADASWARTWWERAIICSDTLTNGGSWALVRKSAVESTRLAQPFCVNQAVGLWDLPQRLHAQFVVVRRFSHW